MIKSLKNIISFSLKWREENIISCIGQLCPSQAKGLDSHPVFKHSTKCHSTTYEVEYTSCIRNKPIENWVEADFK